MPKQMSIFTQSPKIHLKESLKMLRVFNEFPDTFFECILSKITDQFVHYRITKVHSGKCMFSTFRNYAPLSNFFCLFIHNLTANVSHKKDRIQKFNTIHPHTFNAEVPTSWPKLSKFLFRIRFLNIVG